MPIQHCEDFCFGPEEYQAALSRVNARETPVNLRRLTLSVAEPIGYGISDMDRVKFFEEIQKNVRALDPL